MELYIEYVILDNYIIDYIILKLIEVTTNQKIKLVSKFLTCSLGALLAIFLPFLQDCNVLLFCYRIISSVIMVMCIKRHKKLKNFFSYYLMFITYTFLIGGVILGLIQLLNINYTMSGLFIYEFEFPLGVFAVLALLFCNIIIKSIKIIRRKLSLANYNYVITIKDNDTKISAPAFFDTGNNVAFENAGVNIISLNLFLKLYKDIDLYNVILQRVDTRALKSVRYIDIKGIGAGDKYLSFLVDVMEVNGRKFVDARVALSMKNFGEYECILHRDFIKG